VPAGRLASEGGAAAAVYEVRGNGEGDYRALCDRQQAALAFQ
jgi:hypothetical protein